MRNRQISALAEIIRCLGEIRIIHLSTASMPLLFKSTIYPTIPFSFDNASRQAGYLKFILPQIIQFYTD